ncbi:MAG: TonB-dependent receptor [Pseudomonadota bacterium]
MRLIGSISVIALAVSAPAVAQDNTDDTSARQLQTVVVTAQRYEENLQDVPIAVTAFTGSDLKAQSIATLEDLSARVPGFVSTQATGYGQAPLSLRGVGGANGGGNTFADEPMAVYVNGVVQPNVAGTASELNDISSLQVLRGPQGTLYGRNSTAGAVLINTAPPTFDFEGFASVEASTLEDYKGTFVVSGPLAEGLLAGRGLVAVSGRDGYADNLLSSQGIGGYDTLNARGSLLATPSDTIEALLVVDVIDSDFRPVTVGLADLSDLSAVNPFNARPDLNSAIEADEFSYDTPNESNYEATNVSLVVDWDLPFGTVTSTTGYVDLTVSGSQESDGTAQTLSFNTLQGTESETLSQELVLSGGSDRLRWTTGLFYYDNETSLDIGVANGRATFALGNVVNFLSSQETEAYAVFADVAFDFTEDLTFTLGGRYSEEEKSFTSDANVTALRSGAEALEFGFVPPPLQGIPAGFVLSDVPAFDAEETFDDFSIRALLEWEPAEDILLYGSFNEGFKSGGFNAFALSPLDASFDPEGIEAWEIGAKTLLADKALRLNVAAYYYTYDDLQVRIAVPTGGLAIENAAAAEITGFDGELEWQVNETLKVLGVLAYTDAEFTEGTLPNIPETTYAFGAAIPLVDVSVVGNKLSRAPEWQAAVALENIFEVGQFDIIGRASLRYQDEVFFLEANQVAETYREDAYTTLDLRVTVTGDDLPWSLSVYGDNVTDERFLTQVGSFSGLPQGVPNDPARFGIELEYRFGQ